MTKIATSVVATTRANLKSVTAVTQGTLPLARADSTISLLTLKGFNVQRQGVVYRPEALCRTTLSFSIALTV